MDKQGKLGEILEHGKSALGDTGRALKGQLAGFGKAATDQISPNLLGKTQKPSDDELLDQDRDSDELTPPKINKKEDDIHIKEMVKHLYGLDDSKKEMGNDKKPDQEKDGSQKRTLTEEEKIRGLQKILHQEYYQHLTNPPKPKEEERQAEKVEKEERMEKLEEQEKEKKKPPPLAVQRAQQKAEKFPGASG